MSGVICQVSVSLFDEFVAGPGTAGKQELKTFADDLAPDVDLKRRATGA